MDESAQASGEPADVKIGEGGHYEVGEVSSEGEVLTVKIYGVDVPVSEIAAMADRRCGNCWTAYGTPQQGSYVVTRVEKGTRKRYRQLCECAVRRYARAHKPADEAGIAAAPEPSRAERAAGAAERRIADLQKRLDEARAAALGYDLERQGQVHPYEASLAEANAAVDAAERKVADAKATVLGRYLIVANHQERMAILQEAVDQVQGDIAEAQEAAAKAEELVEVKERTLRQVADARDGAQKLWQRELARTQPRADKLSRRVADLEHRLAIALAEQGGAG